MRYILKFILAIICLILLLLGFAFFGWNYALKMVAVTVLYPTFLKATTLITRFIDLENTSLFLIVVIGGACLGLSTGIIKKSGFNGIILVATNPVDIMTYIQIPGPF